MMQSDSGLKDDAAQRAADIKAKSTREKALQDARMIRAQQEALDRTEQSSIMQHSHGDNVAAFAAISAEDYAHNHSRGTGGAGLTSHIGPDGQPFLEPRWQPDSEAPSCNKCVASFDYFNRRHHCRYCGLIFCNSCSSNRALLPVAFKSTDPQRVCGACWPVLEPHQDALADQISNAEKTNQIDLVDGTARYMNMPFSLTLGSEIRKASYSLHNMFSSDWVEDKDIPARLLRDAKGIAFLTVAKAGIVLAPKVGTGLVLAKLPNGSWSAPSAIATMGVSWGLLAGADVTDFVIILNTMDAVKAFSGVGNVQIGAGVDVALGPVGRSGGGAGYIGDKGYAPALCYAHSKGLFVGLSLDGSLIMNRNDVNFNFYGRQHEPMDILAGNVPQPKAAQPLYEAIMTNMTGFVGDNEDGGNRNNRAGAQPSQPRAGASAGAGAGGARPSNNASSTVEQNFGAQQRAALRQHEKDRKTKAPPTAHEPTNFFDDDDNQASINV